MNDERERNEEIRGDDAATSTGGGASTDDSQDATPAPRGFAAENAAMNVGEVDPRDRRAREAQASAGIPDPGQGSTKREAGAESASGRASDSAGAHDGPSGGRAGFQGAGDSSGAGAGEDATGGYGPMGPGFGDSTEQKSAALSVILSVMPGLGQIYCGFYQRGFIHAFTAAAAISILNEWRLRGLHPLIAVFLAFFWIYNMIDAGRCAQAINRAVRGGKPLNLPDAPLSFGQGSRGTGIALVAAGVVLLMVTLFGFSLWWLVDWWPLALVIYGIRLIMQNRSR